MITIVRTVVLSGFVCAYCLMLGCAQPGKPIRADLPDHLVEHDEIVGKVPNLRRFNTRPFYVEYLGSRALTKLLRQLVHDRGLTLADQPSADTHRVIFGGLYRVAGPDHNGGAVVAELYPDDGAIDATSVGGAVRIAPLEAAAYVATFSRLARLGMISASSNAFLSLEAIAQSSGAATAINQKINQAIFGEKNPCLFVCNYDRNYHRQTLSTDIRLYSDGTIMYGAVRSRMRSPSPNPAALLEHNLTVLMEKVLP